MDPLSTVEILGELGRKLARIKESAPPEEKSDIAKREEAAFEEQIQKERQKAEVKGIIQDIEERKKYAFRTFFLICAWLVGVFLLLILQGFFGTAPSSFEYKNGNVLTLNFNLHDSVLLAVVGGTTASIISIFVIVVKYLFSKHE
jgi:hypothetical protein